MVQCPKGLNIPWSKRPQETFRNGSKTDEDPQFKAASFKDCLTDVHETCMTLRWRCFDPYMIGKRNRSISAEVDTLQKQKSVHQMLSRHFSWALGSHSRHSPYIGQRPISIANSWHHDISWLEVDLPLWKMMEWKSVGMMTFPIYGKMKFMFQTTNQSLECCFEWVLCDVSRVNQGWFCSKTMGFFGTGNPAP